MNVRIASAACALPDEIESVDEVLERESVRVEQTLAPLTPLSRQRAMQGLGLCNLRVCRTTQLYDLALKAASSALKRGGLEHRDLDLIIDFSTFPGSYPQSLSFANRLCAELGAEHAMQLSFKAGGCGALHTAIKTALGWMHVDENIRTVLLVTADMAPEGNRSLLPVTVQGDGASAMLLSRDGMEGPLLLGTQALTLGHLHNAISVVQSEHGLELKADALCIEHKVMPIYYLNFHRLTTKVLEAASLGVRDVSHFIYSNISARDRDGFRRTVGLPEGGLPPTPMAELGHTFASDLIINYVYMQERGLIHPGELLLFASAGIGFTWGVTLARA
jgi:3-oxoacyl-[acyl-carrier-protein] synthase-3